MTDLKNVLFISYYFPPSGGPGVQRVLKFAKYLPENGYRPYVLTVPENAEFPARDESLLAECPPQEQIYRSSIVEFYKIYQKLTGKKQSVDATAGKKSGVGERLSKWIRGALFIPDGRMGWVWGGTRTGVEICRRHKISAIVATGPPFTGHWIGERVSRKTGIPLVLDFRDPWTRSLLFPQRPGWAAALDRRLEHRCLSGAARVVTAFTSIADDFAEMYPDLDRSRFQVITNGYDPDDFAESGVPMPSTWTISHTGSILRQWIPRTFLEVFREWAAEQADRTAATRMRFAGWIDPELEELLSHAPFDRVASREGYLAHGESVRLLQKSHLLLLLIVDDPQAGRLIPGKLFEYLATGKPILALAPEGEAADLMRKVGGCRILAPDDSAGIREALETAYNAFLAGRLPFGEPDMDVVREYSRRNLTARLARILDEVTE